MTANPAKILVVDDEPHIAELIRFVVSKDGYEPNVVHNGEDALRQAKEWGPDLIILDVMMPGMDGYEVCEKLKADPQTSAIPVMMLTALNMGENLEQALEKKADWYLTKPFDPAHLRKRVAKLLEKK